MDDNHWTRRARSVLVMGVLLGVACGGGAPAPPPEPVDAHWSSPEVVVLDQTRGPVSLARHDEALVEVRGPQSSRKGPVPRWARLGGEREGRKSKRAIEYVVPLPTRGHHYSDVTTDSPPGMVVTRADGSRLPFEPHSSRVGKPGTWGYRNGELEIRVAAGAPFPKGLRVAFPGAAEEERSRNRAYSELDEPSFVHRTVTTFKDRRTGVFLPAPASADYRVKIGPDAELRTWVRLLQPAFRDQGRSDGARAAVSIVDASGPRELQNVQIAPGRAQELIVDLSEFSGQEVTLRLSSAAEGSALLDYVFFDDPVIRSAKQAPKRLVVVFIDTLRRDHLSLYGHERPTTPYLDQIAKDGVVFEEAYSVAPWTLPSVRSAYTGVLPHRWSPERHLGKVLAEHGWATFSVASNQYLSEQFDLDQHWTAYRGNRGRNAATQVDRVVSYLDKNRHRDVALFLHLIDPHLPYHHRESTKGRFATQPRAGLAGSVSHDAVERAVAEQPDDQAAIVDYVRRRYDEQILYVDQQIQRLMGKVGDDATLVVFSDHGEEFFENGRIGHGHSLADHQVRVPLLISGPGMKPGRTRLPVSLVDVGATVLDLAGVAVPADLDGRSLMPVLEGQSMEPRPVALGWNLFETEAWGVVHDAHTWRLRAGLESLERRGRPVIGRSMEPWREAFSEATGMPVRWTWRVASNPRSTTWNPAVSSFSLTTPTAPTAVWPRLDFYRKRERPAVHGNQVSLASRARRRYGAEFWVLPESLNTAGLQAEFAVGEGAEPQRELIRQDVPPAPGKVLADLGAVTVSWALAPVREAGQDNQELTEDVRRELEALGYLEDGE